MPNPEEIGKSSIKIKQKWANKTSRCQNTNFCKIFFFCLNMYQRVFNWIQLCFLCCAVCVRALCTTTTSIICTKCAFFSCSTLRGFFFVADVFCGRFAFISFVVFIYLYFIFICRTLKLHHKRSIKRRCYFSYYFFRLLGAIPFHIN